jgi:RNA polymerase sigma factor (sigma-70 family)
MLIPWLQPEISIDDRMDENGRRSLEGKLVDPLAENQEQKLYRRELLELVRKALVNLNERERHIIRNRFGILGGGELSLGEIGAGLNLSRERVRQIERVARTKLRKDLICCSPTA